MRACGLVLALRVWVLFKDVFDQLIGIGDPLITDVTLHLFAVPMNATTVIVVVVRTRKILTAARAGHASLCPNFHLGKVGLMAMIFVEVFQSFTPNGERFIAIRAFDF